MRFGRKRTIIRASIFLNCQSGHFEKVSRFLNLCFLKSRINILTLTYRNIVRLNGITGIKMISNLQSTKQLISEWVGTENDPKIPLLVKILVWINGKRSAKIILAGGWVTCSHNSNTFACLLMREDHWTS